MPESKEESNCPECGGKMFNGGTASYLCWCEDPDDNYECLYCEDCGSTSPTEEPPANWKKVEGINHDRGRFP